MNKKYEIIEIMSIKEILMIFYNTIPKTSGPKLSLYISLNWAIGSGF